MSRYGTGQKGRVAPASGVVRSTRRGLLRVLGALPVAATMALAAGAAQPVLGAQSTPAAAPGGGVGSGPTALPQVARPAKALVTVPARLPATVPAPVPVAPVSNPSSLPGTPGGTRGVLTDVSPLPSILPTLSPLPTLPVTPPPVPPTPQPPVTAPPIPPNPVPPPPVAAPNVPVPQLPVNGPVNPAPGGASGALPNAQSAAAAAPAGAGVSSAGSGVGANSPATVGGRVAQGGSGHAALSASSGWFPAAAILAAVPVACPQLAFGPLVAGCRVMLAPIVNPALGLAHTGTSILLGLAGFLLLTLGGALYIGSRRQPRPDGGNGEANGSE